MGTRNLTIVVKGGEIVVAQYGQWDGYPTGNGATVFGFIKNNDMAEFSRKLSVCYFATEEELTHMVNDATGTEANWITMEQADRLKQSPVGHLSRDTGADILQVILDNPEPFLPLSNNIEFTEDGLFCEWAYLVDLDLQQMEIYDGFHLSPPPEDQRFSKASDTVPEGWKPRYTGDQYYFPIQLRGVVSFAEIEQLDELPQDRCFTAEHIAENERLNAEAEEEETNG